MSSKITLFVFFAILFSPKNFSQNSSDTCESDNTDIALDLNSITKCTVKTSDDDKKDKKVSFQVTSRRRVKRKKNAANSILNGDYSQKISDIKKTSNIVNGLSIKGTDKSGVISFYKVDEIPLFKECENSPIYGQKKCFKKQINRHVKLNLKYPERSYKSGIQGRVLANFVIDKNGKVTITNTLFPYKGEQLRDEAKRIINELPAFIPGKQGNSNVSVQYSLRVMFIIPGVKKTNIREKNKVNAVSKAYEFNELQKFPEFENCAGATSPSNCFIEELQQHVTDNFAYPVEALDDEIEGTVTVSFIINTEGKVVNIDAKGPVNAQILETVAKKLVQKLPVFKPALKDNIAVNAKYQFPIEFSIQD